MFLVQGNTTTGVASHSPINTAGSTGAMQVKFLAQGINSKQQCLGIEPDYKDYERLHWDYRASVQDYSHVADPSVLLESINLMLGLLRS